MAGSILQKENTLVVLKLCTCCRENKPISQFYDFHVSPTGRSSTCIDCKAIKSIARRKYVSFQKAKKMYDGLCKKRQKRKELFEVGLKRCCACKRIKPFKFFWRSKKTGYYAMCKGCAKRGAPKAALESRRRDLLRVIFKGAESRAKHKGQIFNITLDYMKDIFYQQKGKCAVSGIEFDMTPRIGQNKFQNPYIPSIDRIDSSKGYLLDNVRWVLLSVNVAMSCWGEEVLVKLAKAILEIRRVKNVR